MAMRMGYKLLGVALVILSVLQFTLGMFLTISGQHCKLPSGQLCEPPAPAAGDFCNAIGSGCTPGGGGASGSGGSVAELLAIKGA
eukprot:COSAG02_NODE_1809_length_10835_cov_7.682843_10_plen_85_part_00